MMSRRALPGGEGGVRAILDQLREASGGYDVACDVLQRSDLQKHFSVMSLDPKGASDLLLIAQALSQPDGQYKSDSRQCESELRFCKLLASCDTKREMVLPSPVVNGLLPILREWVSHTQVNLKTEALHALVAVLDGVSVKVNESECLATLLVLMAVEGEDCIPEKPENEAEWSPPESAGLALKALSIAVSKWGGTIPKHHLQGLTDMLVQLLEKLLRDKIRPCHSEPFSHLLAKLLRCLGSAIHEIDVQTYIPRLIPLLPKLFVYCARLQAEDHNDAQGSAAESAKQQRNGTAPAQGTGRPPAERAYVPPHLRIQQTKRPAPRGRQRHSDAGSVSDGTDESDSDNDSPGFALDVWQSSRVRMAALQILQTIIKAGAKSMQPYWQSMLPVTSPLKADPYTPSLLTVLLYDPHPKIRSAAASTISLLIDGPGQRAYMAIADARMRTSQEAARSFLPLSGQLGQLLVSLHAGLFHSIKTDSSQGVVVSSLRCMAVLLNAAPYDRLPSNLLPEAIFIAQSALARLPGAGVPASDTHRVAVFSCLAAAFSTRAPAPSLLRELQGADPVQVNSTQHGHLSVSTTGIIDALYAAATCDSTMLRTEALLALRGAVKNYPAIFQDRGAVYRVLEANLEYAQGSILSAGESKTLQLSYHLLAGFMQAACGGSELKYGDEQDVQLPGEEMELAAPILFTMDELCRIWRQLIGTYLPRGWSHPAAMVRAAAFGVPLKMGVSVYLLLGDGEKEVLFGATSSAVTNDTDAPVRAAACKCAGHLLTIPSVLKDDAALQLTTLFLRDALQDAALSVRISASWAFANMCGSIQKSFQERTEGDPVLSKAKMQNMIPELAAVATDAVRDNDKVRANAIRALGNVIAAASASPEQMQLKLSWIDDAMRCLTSGITTGNVKVQWNACFAASSLMQNQNVLALPSVQSRLPGLLMLLIMLVRDCANFKIRTHAAAAIRALRHRSQYQDTYPDALQVVAANVADSTTAPSISSHDKLPGNPNQGDIVQLPILRRQCQATLLHLLAVASPEDSAAVQDTLVRRRGLLLAFVEASAIAVGACGSTKNQAAAFSNLPGDPFGLEGSAYSEDTPIRSSASSHPAGADGWQQMCTIEEPPLFSREDVAAAMIGMVGLYSGCPTQDETVHQLQAMVRRAKLDGR